MKKSYFITGTNTDIGKTFVSALIIKDFINKRKDVVYYKPVLSGYLENENDILYVKNISGLPYSQAYLSSYLFNMPASPHLASSEENIVIDKNVINEHYAELCKKHDIVIVEGAGGVVCPISYNTDLILQEDIIKMLNIEVIIVADAGLGSINHTTITVEYIKNKDISIKGIVLNNFDENNKIHLDNMKMIKELTNVDILAKVKKGDERIKWDIMI